MATMPAPARSRPTSVIERKLSNKIRTDPDLGTFSCGRCEWEINGPTESTPKILLIHFLVDLILSSLFRFRLLKLLCDPAGDGGLLLHHRHPPHRHRVHPARGRRAHAETLVSCGEYGVIHPNGKNLLLAFLAAGWPLLWPPTACAMHGVYGGITSQILINVRISPFGCVTLYLFGNLPYFACKDSLYTTHC